MNTFLNIVAGPPIAAIGKGLAWESLLMMFEEHFLSLTFLQIQRASLCHS